MVFQKKTPNKNKTPNMKNKKSLGMSGGDSFMDFEGGDDGKSGNKSMQKTPKGKQFSADKRVSFQVSQKTPQSHPVKQRQATPGTAKGQTAMKEFQGMKGKSNKQNKNNNMSDEDDEDDEDDDEDMDNDIDMDLAEEDDDSDDDDDDDDNDDDETENNMSKASIKKTVKQGGDELQKKNLKVTGQKKKDEEEDEDDEDDDEEEDDSESEDDVNENKNVSIASFMKTTQQISKESNKKSPNAKTVKQGNELNKKDLNLTSQKKRDVDEDDDEEEDDDDDDEEDEDEEEEDDEENEAEVETKKKIKDSPSNANKKMQKQDVQVKHAKTFESNKAEGGQKTLHGTPNNCKLFIGNLPTDIQKDEVKSLSPDITDVFIADNKRAQRKFAFVTFASEALAEKNFSVLEKQTFKGQPIKVDFVGEKRKNAIPEKSRNNTLTLIVLGIPPEVTISEIASFFPKCRSINFTFGERRNAFVIFENATEAENAMNNNKTIKISGHEMRVDFARQRNEGGFKRRPFGQKKFPFAKKMRRDQ